MTAPISSVVFRLAARVRRTAQLPQFDLSPALDRLGEDIAMARSLGPDLAASFHRRHPSASAPRRR